MTFSAPFRVQPHTLVSHVYDHPEVIVRWADWLYSMEGNRGEVSALELGQIEPALKDAVESAIARFVTGNLNIDDDWDGHVREMEGLGRDRYLELYQQALDAKRAATQ